MSNDSLVPHFIVNTGDATYFDFFDLFVSDVSHAELILSLRQIYYFLVRPPSFLCAFRQSDPLFQLFGSGSIVFRFCVVLVAVCIAVSMGLGLATLGLRILL